MTKMMATRMRTNSVKKLASKTQIWNDETVNQNDNPMRNLQELYHQHLPTFTDQLTRNIMFNECSLTISFGTHISWLKKYASVNTLVMCRLCQLKLNKVLKGHTYN